MVTKLLSRKIVTKVPVRITPLSLYPALLSLENIVAILRDDILVFNSNLFFFSYRSGKVSLCAYLCAHVYLCVYLQSICISYAFSVSDLEQVVYILRKLITFYQLCYKYVPVLKKILRWLGVFIIMKLYLSVFSNGSIPSLLYLQRNFYFQIKY